MLTYPSKLTLTHWYVILRTSTGGCFNPSIFGFNIEKLALHLYIYILYIYLIYNLYKYSYYFLKVYPWRTLVGQSAITLIGSDVFLIRFDQRVSTNTTQAQNLCLRIVAIQTG